MGPEHGTPKYKKQVKEIVGHWNRCDFEEDEITSFLMMFIMDKSYARAAICEAENKIKKTIKK